MPVIHRNDVVTNASSNGFLSIDSTTMVAAATAVSSSSCVPSSFVWQSSASSVCCSCCSATENAAPAHCGKWQCHDFKVERRDSSSPSICCCACLELWYASGLFLQNTLIPTAALSLQAAVHTTSLFGTRHSPAVVPEDRFLSRCSEALLDR